MRFLRYGFLSIFLFVGFHLLAFYGGDMCHSFKVKLTLNNKTEVRGYIQGYNSILVEGFTTEIKQCDSKIRKSIIKASSYLDTIKVYDTVFNVNYPSFPHMLLTASLAQKVVQVDINQIAHIEILSISPCQKWLDRGPESENYFASDGMNTPILELSAAEISKLQNEPTTISEFTEGRYKYEDYYYFCSYKKEIG